MRRTLLFLALLIGTGHADAPKESAARLAAAASKGDVAAIRAMLRDSVIFGGLWFDDADCRKQFGAPDVVRSPQLDAFAACLAKLKLEVSTQRVAWAAVLVYKPGIEIEAMFSPDPSILMAIGWFWMSDDGRPNITQDALEARRSTRDPF